MGKYLISASYTVEGMKGLIKGGGGTARKQAIEALLKSVGSLESIYYAFGQEDVYLIASVPDHVSAAAIALTVNASGAASVKTTILMTPEEVDQAAKKTVSYRAPGH